MCMFFKIPEFFIQIFIVDEIVHISFLFQGAFMLPNEIKKIIIHLLVILLKLLILLLLLDNFFVFSHCGKEASRLNHELKDSEKERRKLEKELQRKEKALAEAAALLVLSKKANAIWGGFRGRMISASDRENAVLLINEAIKSGASCKKACERFGITERTFYRWKKRKSGY